MPIVIADRQQAAAEDLQRTVLKALGLLPKSKEEIEAECRQAEQEVRDRKKGKISRLRPKLEQVPIRDGNEFGLTAEYELERALRAFLERLDREHTLLGPEQQGFPGTVPLIPS